MQATNKKNARKAAKEAKAAQAALAAQESAAPVTLADTVAPVTQEAIAIAESAPVVTEEVQIGPTTFLQIEKSAAPTIPANTPPAAQNGSKVVLHFAGKEVRPNRPQNRIILFLAQNAGKSYSRKEISAKHAANVDYPYCTSHLGSERDDIRQKNDGKIYPSLKSLGLVSSSSAQGGTVYAITELGRRFAAELQAPNTVVAPSAPVVS